VTATGVNISAVHPLAEPANHPNSWKPTFRVGQAARNLPAAEAFVPCRGRPAGVCVSASALTEATPLFLPVLLRWKASRDTQAPWLAIWLLGEVTDRALRFRRPCAQPAAWCLFLFLGGQTGATEIEDLAVCLFLLSTTPHHTPTKTNRSATPYAAPSPCMRRVGGTL
jgi:hypothetical protein